MLEQIKDVCLNFVQFIMEVVDLGYKHQALIGPHGDQLVAVRLAKLMII